MSMKRKANALGPMDTPDNKRRKAAQGFDGETPETTFHKGLEILNQLKNSQDKQDHYIATHFLTLPNRNEIPEYYEEIALPIAIDTIEAKLYQREYANLSQVESDFKRMISNAKQFNQKGSDVHNDAEKIRKNISNSMRKHNPAYDDPTYTALPTPLPNEPMMHVPMINYGNSPSMNTDVDTPSIGRKRQLTLNGPRALDEEVERTSATPVAEAASEAVNEAANVVANEAANEGESDDFRGLTFQKAQEQLIEEMMQLENENGDDVSQPFLNRPPRDLKDYYDLIKNVISLKDVQKRIQGYQGRKEPPLKYSHYKSWQALYDDMSFIWKNAREYNEDDSLIFSLAGELEEYFEKRFSLAKAAVPDVQPKINLKVGANPDQPSGTKIRINMGPRTSSADSNGVIVDSAALKRQQDLVAAGANGQASSNTITVGAPADASQVNGVGSTRPAVNGTVLEGRPSPSPALGRSNSRDAGSMPPPAAGSPPVASSSPHPPVLPPVTNPLDNRFRTLGKTDADALIQNLSVSAHPMLLYPRGFHLNLGPSPILSQQSTLINVPSELSWIRVVPTFISNLASRHHKYFVTHDHQKIEAIASHHDGPDAKGPMYDIKVHSGLNTIECEVITGPPRGVPKIGTGTDVEFEKSTVFVNRLT